MISKKVGFVGLGTLGKPMAKNLVGRGFELTVIRHIRPEPVEELKTLGAKVAASPKELAQSSDFIITMVRTTAQTEEVIFGKDGLWDGMRAGTTLIIMSTIAPKFVQEAWRKANEKGVAVLEAPVSAVGGVSAAEKGTLTIMVGGDAKVFEECRFLFEAMGKSIFHIGDVGSAMVAKLANNTMLALNMFGVLHVLRLGVRAGVSPERLLEAIRVSTGKSWVVENWGRYEGYVRDYRENPRGSVLATTVDKDVGLALELAKEVGVRLPMVALISHLDIGEIWACFCEDKARLFKDS